MTWAESHGHSGNMCSAYSVFSHTSLDNGSGVWTPQFENYVPRNPWVELTPGAVWGGSLRLQCSLAN